MGLDRYLDSYYLKTFMGSQKLTPNGPTITMRVPDYNNESDFNSDSAFESDFLSCKMSHHYD